MNGNGVLQTERGDTYNGIWHNGQTVQMAKEELNKDGSKSREGSLSGTPLHSFRDHNISPYKDGPRL